MQAGTGKLSSLLMWDELLHEFWTTRRPPTDTSIAETFRMDPSKRSDRLMIITPPPRLQGLLIRPQALMHVDQSPVVIHSYFFFSVCGC